MEKIIEAYPLYWPFGYTRTPERISGTFKTTFDAARKAIFYELDKLQAENIILSTNIPLRKDGMPYASYAGMAKDDPGVAVYFTLAHTQRVLCCDRYYHINHNLQAIAKTLNALRGIDRWGVSDMLERIFTGFLALPEPEKSIEPWWQVLNVPEKASPSIIKSAYKELVKKYHPDVYQGDTTIFHKVQQAYQQAISK